MEIRHFPPPSLECGFGFHPPRGMALVEEEIPEEEVTQVMEEVTPEEG
jgi:hypothetical protein